METIITDTPTGKVVQMLTEKIALVKELEQSKLYESAEYVANKIGRNSAKESENDYWLLTDKQGRVITDGSKAVIDKWIGRRRISADKVYFRA